MLQIRYVVFQKTVQCMLKSIQLQVTMPVCQWPIISNGNFTGLKMGVCGEDDLNHNKDIQMVLNVRQELHINAFVNTLNHFSLSD